MPVPLYKVLNAPFHSSSRSPSTIANQAPFLKLMAQALRALAKAGKAFSYCGPAYRGVKVASSPLLKRKDQLGAQEIDEKQMKIDEKR